jgi:5-methylcytosine-specific restriction endonuclease McrA
MVAARNGQTMSEHHKQKKWANYAKKARAILKAQLPLPCVECGAPVYPDDSWDVGHLFPLSQGGDVNQYGASHRSCNRSQGGKLGASKTHEKKKQIRKW